MWHFIWDGSKRWTILMKKRFGVLCWMCDFDGFYVRKVCKIIKKRQRNLLCDACYTEVQWNFYPKRWERVFAELIILSPCHCIHLFTYLALQSYLKLWFLISMLSFRWAHLFFLCCIHNLEFAISGVYKACYMFYTWNRYQPLKWSITKKKKKWNKI